MFKKFVRFIFRGDNVPLTPQDLEFITNGDELPEAERAHHQRALQGSRLACHSTSLAYWKIDLAKSYFWSCVADLAVEPNAASWFQSLQKQLPLEQQRPVARIALKWYLANQEAFEATRRQTAANFRELGMREPRNW
jgi:hypothetical protein